MNTHHHHQKIVFLTSFSCQSAVAFDVRRPRAIVHLVVACVCAFWHCFPARGPTRVGHLSVSDKREPVSNNFVTIRAPVEAIQYVGACPDKNAGRTQFSGADILCESHEKMQTRRLLRRLQRDRNALSTVYNSVKMRNPLDLGAVPPLVRPQPAMDVTFLFAPSQHREGAPSSFAHASHSRQEELSFARGFNSSQISDPPQPAAKGRSGNNAIMSSHDGDSSTAYDYLLEDRRRQAPPDFAFTRRIYPQSEAGKDTFPAHEDFYIRGSIHPSQNAETHVHPQTPFYTNGQEPTSSQLQMGVHTNRLQPLSPQLSHNIYPLRQNNFENLTQEDATRSNMSSERRTAGGSYPAPWDSPSEFSGDLEKRENSILSYSPVRDVASVANSSRRPQGSPNSMSVPAEATIGVLRALLGHLLPLLSPLLRMQVLTSRLFNRQSIPGEVSPSKEATPVIPHTVTPVRPDQASASTASSSFATYPNPNHFSTSTRLDGIMPFLSDLLTGMSLPHGVLNLLDPSSQKLHPRADAQDVSRDSGNYNTSREIFQESAEVTPGTRSGDTPAGSAQSAYAEPQEIVKSALAFRTAVADPSRLWRIDDTPLASGSPASTNNEVIYPASMLHSPLPRPNRHGNMTAPMFPPRPAQSTPPHELPTAHLRYIGDLDSDMGDFFNSVVQRVWRTSSGPSSFMRVPPPLYSHRAEGITDEVAVTQGRGTQPLQQEVQQEGNRIPTFVSREAESLRADSEVTIEGPSQDEFGRSRWMAPSQDNVRRPSVLLGAADESSPSSLHIRALPLVLDKVERAAEAILPEAGEKMSSFVLEEVRRNTGIHDPELRMKWAQQNVFGSNWVGPANGADEEKKMRAILLSSQQHDLSLRDGAGSTPHSVSTSPAARTADSNINAGTDPDPAANVVHGWAPGKSLESILMRHSEKNSDKERDCLDILRCGNGTQESNLTHSLSRELPIDRLKIYVPLSVQQLENTDGPFIPLSQLSLLRRHDLYVGQGGDKEKASGKINVVPVSSTGSERPAASDKDSAQLLSSIPCSSDSCQAGSTGDLPSSSDGAADRVPVHVRSHRGRISQMCLTTMSAGDEKEERCHPDVLDSQKAAEYSERFRTRFNVHATNGDSTKNVAHPRSEDNRHKLVVNTQPDVQPGLSGIRELPAREKFQFLNAEWTVHSPEGDGDSIFLDALRREDGQMPGENFFGCIIKNLPSESLGIPNQQPKAKHGTTALREDPECAESTAGQQQNTVHAVWGISQSKSDDHHLPQSENSTLFWFREASGGNEDQSGFLEHPTSNRSLIDRTASLDSSGPYEDGGLQRFRTKQLNFVDNLSRDDETVKSEYPWSWEDTGEDFFLAFNGFPTPYDYYFPLNFTEEDPFQQPFDQVVSGAQGMPPDGATGASQSERHDDHHLSPFPSGNTVTPRDDLEIYPGTSEELPGFDTIPYRGVNLFENRQYASVGGEEHPVFTDRPPYPNNENMSPPYSTAIAAPSYDENPPLLSKLSSFFTNLPLADWLRLDPTRVGPFDWKKVFGDLIPMGRRLKRAKEMAGDVIFNEYCNRTASESSPGNSSAMLRGFSFSVEDFTVPDRIQSDFQKCVEHYRVRTKEYVEEYRNQCHEVWEDPRAPNYVHRNFVTIDDVADCLVQKYDVGRRWFNELFYQPWYRLMNQTSYLLQAVDTAFAEIQYDAWFFPAAYSAANFGLWRVCSQVEDCFNGETCVEALPRIYNFTLSFCHHTPESMNLDPITGMPLAEKFS